MLSTGDCVGWHVKSVRNATRNYVFKMSNLCDILTSLEDALTQGSFNLEEPCATQVIPRLQRILYAVKAVNLAKSMISQSSVPSSAPATSSPRLLLPAKRILAGGGGGAVAHLTDDVKFNINRPNRNSTNFVQGTDAYSAIVIGKTPPIIKP